MEFTQMGPEDYSKDPNVLDKFGRNMNELVSSGKLDPVIGRDEEIRKVIQVLARKSKNNVVLPGNRALAKPRSSRGSRNASSRTTCPPPSRGRKSTNSIWAPSWQGPSTAASSRNA